MVYLLQSLLVTVTVSQGCIFAKHPDSYYIKITWNVKMTKSLFWGLQQCLYPEWSSFKR